MKYYRRYFLLYIFLLLIPVLGLGQSKDTPYKDGESLTYILNYKWGGINTDVGEAVTNLKYSDGMFHCIIKGRTYRFYDLFFTVREHFESKFYDTPIKPHYFYRDTREGKYKMKNTFYFDNEKHTIKAKVQRNDSAPKDTILVANKETYDLPSLFYKVRRIDFENIPIGVKQSISFAIDTDVYNFYYIYQGKEVKKVQGLGIFKTLKFSVKLVAGEVFTGKEDMTIWVTDDENKIPLLFESPIIVGRVSGRLSKFSNLKCPLTSKIK